jgi:hypothetical protein
MSPKTLRSHKTTTMTTTAFKIDLMEPAIGMYELTSQRRTPTTTRTITTWTKGMIYSFFCWEIGPVMKRQPIFVCPKLLLGTWFLSLTPKADPILDDQAINVSLMSVCPLPERGPRNPPGEPLVIVIGLGNRPHLALFPYRQFPSMVPSPECLFLKIITHKTMSRFILD